MRCEVAENSVVVMKSRPAKAGNRLEDKTGTTHRLVGGGRSEPKAVSGSAKGGRSFEGFRNLFFLRHAGHKPPDGAGHAIGGRP
jgi:hypothetical protein